jgi:DNA-directed RNA polymerase subunit beta'
MTIPEPFDPDSLLAGGHAFKAMLSDVDVAGQIRALKAEIPGTKSPSKRDALVKKLKYLAGVHKMDESLPEVFTLSHMPVIPPSSRPPTPQGGNRIEYADSNMLYKDHMTVNNGFKDIAGMLSNDNTAIRDSRRDLYDGAKAVMGVGDAITGSSRGHKYKGFLKQVAGEGGPKTGFFQSKILSKKQDFSGRATIYAEPNLGFNEAAIPKDMLWTMFEFHIIRDLVKSGYDYVSAKKAVAARDTAATNSFNKLIKQIPVIMNRAPTLMQSNITAHYAVPIEGKTVGVNPLHLPLYAGDFDGDALSIHLPMTPEAIDEARTKLLPESHMYDFRDGLGQSMVAPGHEAIIGSMHITEPDPGQKVVHFKTEEAAMEALRRGDIKENTPISIG